MIRELREENAKLKAQMQSGSGPIDPNNKN